MTEQDNEKLTIESDALAEAQAVPADEIIISYKGFDKNLRCRDFQFEIGKTYAMDGEIKACKRGFHACEFPLDVFKYYLPGKSRFCVVKQQGPFGRHDEDTKVASARITVDAEIHIPAIVERAIAWISEKLDPAKVEHATGDRSASSATGDSSASSATGNSSASSATGYSSASSATGIGAVAMSIGKDSKSKAAKDGAIVCVYRDGDHNLIHIRAAKVGGSEGIKPDVWYTLDIEGNFTEVEK
jgi:hypothetical protein